MANRLPYSSIQVPYEDTLPYSPAGSLADSFLDTVNNRMTMRDMDTIAAGRKSLSQNRKNLKSSAQPMSQRKKADDDYEAKRQMAIAMEVAAADTRDGKVATESPPPEVTRDMAIAMEVAAADTRDRLAAEQAATRMAAEEGSAPKVNPLDKVAESLKSPNTIFKSEGSLSDMANAPISENMKSPAEPSKAEPVFDQALVNKLFETTHGTSFNPKSQADMRKKMEIESLLEEMGGLGDMTPNQFALQLYRRSK
jgi:hypothetical protein